MGQRPNHTGSPDGPARSTRASECQAFNALFETLWPPMHAYAASLTMDKALAQDLVQEVWIDYWQRKEEVEIHHIKPYLYRAIRYKCYNTLRDRKFNKIQIDVAMAVGEAPEMELQENVAELRQSIETILSELPKRCQEIFRLSRINQVSNREIADELKISQRSVENQLSLALRRLRKELATAHLYFL